MGQKKKRVFCGYINIKRNDKEKAGDDGLIQFTLDISSFIKTCDMNTVKMKT